MKNLVKVLPKPILISPSNDESERTDVIPLCGKMERSNALHRFADHGCAHLALVYGDFPCQSRTIAILWNKY
jgi:hypothetical protein